MSYARRSRKPVRYVYKYRPEEIVISLPVELQEIIWTKIPKFLRCLSKAYKEFADKHTVMKYDDNALRTAVLDNDYKFVQRIAESGQVSKKRWKFEANNIMWHKVHPQILKVLMPYMRNPEEEYFNCITTRRYHLACVLVHHPQVNPNINLFWPEFNGNLAKEIIDSGKFMVDGATACNIMTLEDSQYVKLVLNKYPVGRERIGIWMQHALKYNRYDNVKLLAEYL